MKRKKKVLKLKRYWCFMLGVVVCFIFTMLAMFIYNELQNEARKCDQKLGRTCSIYELKNYKNK